MVRIELRAGQTYELATHEPANVRDLRARLEVVHAELDEVKEHRANLLATIGEDRAHITRLQDENSAEIALLRQWRVDVTSAVLGPGRGGICYDDVPGRVKELRDIELSLSRIKELL